MTEGVKILKKYLNYKHDRLIFLKNLFIISKTCKNLNLYMSKQVLLIWTYTQAGHNYVTWDTVLSSSRVL